MELLSELIIKGVIMLSKCWGPISNISILLRFKSHKFPSLPCLNIAQSVNTVILPRELDNTVISV